MKKNLILLLITTFLAITAKAQQITNVQVEQDGDNVVIGYDITNGKQGQKFDISISVSADGGKTFTIIPLSISGDLKQIIAGTGKRITWNVLADRDETVGDYFVFKIIAKVSGGEDFGIQMVFVQGGTFTMGCTFEQGSDCSSDEKPSHSVTLSDYYIGKFEVTQKQWRVIMGSDPPELYFKGCDDCPVERVSWNDAQEFITKLNSKTGKTYRLPTEAEWEYAARGGSKSVGYKYSGSNNIDEVAWYSDNSGSKTHPVGQKKANELGIYDMSGNVWEWCSDWFKGYPGSSGVTDYTGSYRVNRGGSWNRSAINCRSANRSGGTPDNRSSSIGFRLVSPK
jgi:formylglycine-generating enzyme required for sulfatase activity